MTKAEIYEEAIISVVASTVATMMSASKTVDRDACMEMADVLTELKSQYDYYAAKEREG